MQISPKFLIITLAAVGIIFLGFTVIRLGGLLAPNSAPPLATSGAGVETGMETGTQVPPNASLPDSTNGDLSSLLENQIQKPAATPGTGQTTKPPSIPEIQKKIQASLPLKAPKEESLALPFVADSEIKIDQAGLKTSNEYLVYFAQNAKDIPFDRDRLKTVLKNQYDLSVPPFKLIEYVLEGDTSPALLASLETFKDVSKAEISYFGTVGVSGEAAVFNKKMIGLQKLQIQLIDKGLAVLSGSASKSDLQDFYTKWRNTGFAENRALLSGSGLLGESEGGFFKKTISRIAEFFGFKKKAAAQMPSGGGRFTALVPCTCSTGDYLIYVSGIPAALYINQFWAAANFALFLAGPPFPGMEGLYTYAGGTACLQVPFCEPSGFGFLPIIMGTGL